jgi:methyl-accepting chemotaxis protein
MKKISMRIILPVVLLVIIIISASSFAIFTNFKMSLRNNSEEKIFALTESEAVEIEDKLENVQLLTQNLKTLVITTMDYENVKNDRNLMDAYEKDIEDTFLKTIENFDSPSGWVVFDSKYVGGGHTLSFNIDNEGKYTRNAEYDARGAGYINDPWYANAIKMGSWWTMPYYWEEWDQNIISYSEALEIEGEKIATVGADFYFDDLKKEIAAIKIYESGFMTLMDKNFNILFHPDESAQNLRTYNNGDLEEIANQIQNNEKQTDIIEYEFDGEDKLWVYYRLSNGWILSAHPVISEMFFQLEATQKIMIFFSSISISIAIIISFFIGKSISKPIILLSKIIEKLSNYDLSFEENSEAVKYMQRKDEIGTITNALAKMQYNFIDIIKQVSHASQQVSLSSEELTATSGQVSLSSEEVAKTIEEIASGATDQARETTDGALQINVLGEIIASEIELVKILNASAIEVNRLKEEGFVVLKDLEQKTSENNHAAKEVQGIIMDTNENADKIESASDMIKGIAEQTNLLALNASIEAARAGEAGKGFAVVAEEIRKLAVETNQFAGEISNTIANLSKMTEKGVTTMNKAEKIVEAQILSLGNTHHKFEGISEAIEQVKNVAQELNESTARMLDKKTEIINIIENLSAISEENAASTEEASASVEEQTASIVQISEASEELSKLAEDMQGSISKFNI